VVAENTDKKTHSATTAITKLRDDQEREFDPSIEGSIAVDDGRAECGTLFGAGATGRDPEEAQFQKREGTSEAWQNCKNDNA
jgi:hypothetical protein